MGCRVPRNWEVAYGPRLLGTTKPLWFLGTGTHSCFRVPRNGTRNWYPYRTYIHSHLYTYPHIVTHQLYFTLLLKQSVLPLLHLLNLEYRSSHKVIIYTHMYCLYTSYPSFWVPSEHSLWGYLNSVAIFWSYFYNCRCLTLRKPVKAKLFKLTHETKSTK